MARVKIGTLGKSLAVRVPNRMAKAAGLSEGESVDIESRNGQIIIQRPTSQVTLEELFTGKSEQEWRRAYARAFDWGPDLGAEVVEK